MKILLILALLAVAEALLVLAFRALQNHNSRL